MPYAPDAKYETPEDINPLWRYMCLWKFLYLLQNSALWFSGLPCLEDQREGWLTTPELEAALSAGTVGELYKDALELERRRRFVNCWFAGDDESTAMWKLFGAVAVKSSVGRIKGAIESTPRLIKIARVNYVRWDSECMTSEIRTRATAARKSIPYGHEQEVRLIAEDEDWPSGEALGRVSASVPARSVSALLELRRKGNSSASGQDQDELRRLSFEIQKAAIAVLTKEPIRPGLAVEVYLGELIEEVVVGPESPDWYIDSLSELLSKYNLSSKAVKSSSLR